MTEYLKYEFQDTPEFVSTFDELPLWSAAFGLMLLKHLELKRDIRVVDIGSGAGFPLLELAERLGESCKCFGIDPWTNANERAARKIRNYDVSNVELIECSADRLPFGDESIDLVVSNLGINNFENPAKIFGECHRVLKQGGKLALTTNLDGHWQTFYNIFEDTLRERGYVPLVDDLHAEQRHRGTQESIGNLFTGAGFTVARHYNEKLEMNFLDGTAFLNHHFVKLGWLGSWKKIIPPEKQQEVFQHLEENLNSYARQKGGLLLQVPMLYIEGVKQ